MKRLLLFLAILALAAVPAQASILGSHLTFDGIVDTIVDDSRANFYDTGTVGFSAGDVVYGFISVSDFSDTPVGSDQVVIVFAAEILSPIAVNAAAPLGGWTLGPSTVAGYTVDDLVGPGLNAAVDPTVAPAGATTADALAIVLSNPGTTDPLLPELPDTPFPIFTSPAWTYEMTLGFDPGPDGVTNTGDEPDLFHFATIGFGNVVGSESAGMSVFDHPFGANVIFLPVSVNHFDGSGPTTHDVKLVDGTIYPGAGTWDFEDNSNMQINATPEPASLAVWLGLGAIGWAARRRRRRD